MKALWLFLIGLLASAPAWCDQIVWNQPFDQTGYVYASQNDTNGFGLYAQVYDNFTLTTNANANLKISWEGAYFNPSQQGQITGWTINLYADNADKPGNLLYTNHYVGNLNETFLGTFGGNPVYSYQNPDPMPWVIAFNTRYWVSVYPDLGFPPQWGWATGLNGDGIAYQDYFGVQSQLNADMAFTLTLVPEPSSILMLGTGLLAAAGVVRRRLL